MMRQPSKPPAARHRAGEATDANSRAAKVELGLDQGLQALASTIRDAGAGHPTSPTREILERLGDQWSVLLLSVLSTGCFRHAELHRAVNTLNRLVPKAAISQRMLTLRLRALVRDGLVMRLVGEGKAPTVHYALTSLGRGLMPVLQSLLDWSVDHTAEIRAAQAAFDTNDGFVPFLLRGRQHRTR